MTTKAEIEAMSAAKLKAYLEGCNVQELKQSIEIINRPTLRYALEVINQATLNFAIKNIDRPTLKIGLESVDKATLANALQGTDIPMLKVGLECIDKYTLANAMEYIDAPTLRNAVRIIDMATLWYACSVVDDATLNQMKAAADAPTLANINYILANNCPRAGAPKNSVNNQLPAIQNKLCDILKGLAKGNKGDVSVNVNYVPPSTVHFDADIRCKSTGFPPYDVTFHSSGDIDFSNPASVKDIKICVDLPLDAGRACVTLEQLYELVSAIQ